jgi:carbon-monoxide dehydrogenase medium subunit
LDEALDLLNEYKGRARLIAGGTALLVPMKRGILTPQYLISLNNIPHLDGLHVENRILKLGARCTISTIETHPIIKERWRILAQAAKSIGSVQIRNVATVGGNICSAVPSADMVPSLITLGAKVVLVSKAGKRTLPLEDFFKGVGEVDLKESEVLTEIQIPELPPKSGGGYLKFSRRKAMDLPIVGVAAIVSLDESNSTCRGLKVALGAVAPTPFKIKGIEKLAMGRELDDDLIDKISEKASWQINPNPRSFRSSVEYRREMVKVLTRRILKEARSLAKQN